MNQNLQNLFLFIKMYHQIYINPNLFSFTAIYWRSHRSTSKKTMAADKETQAKTYQADHAKT